MDSEGNDHGGRLAFADGTAANAVGRMLPRTEDEQAVLRFYRGGQSVACPVLVPPSKYFVSRERDRPLDAEYWKPRRDPDGILRDGMTRQEESQYLLDCADELILVEQSQFRSVLDVGCGPGWFLSAIDCPHKAGVEVCPLAIAEARGRGLEISESLEDFDGSEFQLVRCSHVIEHLDDPVTAIRQMRSLCAGHLIISTPDFGSPCAAKFRSRYRMLHDHTHVSLFTNESMHRFLRDNGFDIRRVTYPYPLRYATDDLHLQWRKVDGFSPPWPGNWMTFYCTAN